MKTAFLLVVLFVTALTGCVSKSGAKQREQEAFLKGQQQAFLAQQQAQLQAQQPAVWFRGLVRHSRVPWTEGLTLTRALVAAEYTGALDPTTLKITRQGQTYPIKIKALLRGEDDPPLEPGDIIEVTR